MDPIKYISQFSRLGKRVSDLSRIGALLDAVGRPQDSLRFIHIAGTNGKGSMAQMFSEVLTCAGYRVGLFTSPYIFTFYDRIRLNNQNISESELSEILEEISPVIDSHPLRDSFSQFEVTQAAAFVWYKRKGCNVVVLEAGLGGLLDSTNIIDSSLVSVIGSVALDHTAILGSTVEEIAFQKAGIIKQGRPCVLSAGAGESIVSVFREQAQAKGAELVIPESRLCRVQRSDLTGCVFTYRGRQYRTAMTGTHQVNNAITVIEALRLIADVLPVSEENICEGIGRARLAGRVEILSEKPLTVLDGSHNPDGMKALARALELTGGRRIRAVIGMHTDKNAHDAIAMLIPKVYEFYPVSGFSDRDYSCEELAEIISSEGGRALITDCSVTELVKHLGSEHPDDILLICGSLYLVSYIHSELDMQCSK